MRVQLVILHLETILLSPLSIGVFVQYDFLRTQVQTDVLPPYSSLVEMAQVREMSCRPPLERATIQETRLSNSFSNSVVHSQKRDATSDFLFHKTKRTTLRACLPDKIAGRSHVANKKLYGRTLTEKHRAFYFSVPNDHPHRWQARECGPWNTPIQNVHLHDAPTNAFYGIS